ncbi:hypothetical protein GGR55DRAFT_47029 [Xylaria sp. FL0064]|nr:hypothetical protein GGR55DRAFT_47029 [Xylaria sp. FL0064]
MPSPIKSQKSIGQPPLPLFPPLSRAIFFCIVLLVPSLWPVAHVRDFPKTPNISRRSRWPTFDNPCVRIVAAHPHIWKTTSLRTERFLCLTSPINREQGQLLAKQPNSCCLTVRRRYAVLIWGTTHVAYMFQFNLIGRSFSLSVTLSSSPHIFHCFCICGHYDYLVI